ncbi:MAG: hypothetical protein SPH68_00225 [Candidatus Borkfalkiaceae bacterium]|nr:hypothetical protein [Clostridia bacterium]MDY6222574.1 hypothetical protein [Christensenellaceae bacterium]
MKKLFPAICMTLLAAALLGTSTFAWFSMNTQVTATGMQVTAKTDTTYLLISETNSSAEAIQTENATTVALTVSDDQAKVYPCAPALNDTEVGYLTVASGHKTVDGADITTAGEKVTSATTADTVTNWYTANAAAPGASTIKADTARQLTSFAGYVIKKTVHLTVAKGANPANNLSVTAAFTKKGDGSNISAAKVLVTTSDGGIAILDSTTTTNTEEIKGGNTNLTDSTVLTVNIYIYYDGNNEAVNTNNAANLAGATVALTFNVDAVPAA